MSACEKQWLKHGLESRKGSDPSSTYWLHRTVGKAPEFSKPWFPHPWKGINSTCLLELSWELKAIKHLMTAQCPAYSKCSKMVALIIKGQAIITAVIISKEELWAVFFFSPLCVYKDESKHPQTGDNIQVSLHFWVVSALCGQALCSGSREIGPPTTTGCGVERAGFLAL